MKNAPPGATARTPAEALRMFHVPPDLRIDQVLTEPVVAQPVFFNFDERGRLWVMQYLQYPEPAGLKVVSHDNIWRAVYDKVPPPPPHHPRGRDKITIHESTRHDGVYDRHTTFLDGLNIATAVERGRGGVWVLNPPYLLFYPDADNDDVPDRDPVVHLAGFGIEDTHGVVNSLRWGPDGWLYGAQGSMVSGHILRPGLDREPISHSLGQQIWRYHPETRRYEIFAEGGGNAFGLEIDAEGRIFSGYNFGDARGFHYQQGAYLRKGFDRHGALANPYAFGYFMPMAHHAAERFTHTFVIYEGGALPPRYAGKLLGLEILQGRITETEIVPDQSTFRTRDLAHVVTTDDRWFRPVDVKVGPDGGVYVADWYDLEVNHLYNQHDRVDRRRGRIYRLRAADAPPAAPFDLSRLSSLQLLEYLDHPNKWFRQTALRLFGDRRDASAIPALTRRLFATTGQGALEALWALNLSGGLTTETALQALDHANPFVRQWTARLLCDENQVPTPLARQLVRMARHEPDLEARAQLASSARRLPARDALAIIRPLLARDEDAGDVRLPLLLWWAIESKAETDRAAVIALFEDPAVWQFRIVREHLLERIMRRYAQAGGRQDLLTCARLFALAPGREHSLALLQGFEAAFAGRSLGGLPDELLAALARFDSGSIALGLRQGRPDAIASALRTIADPAGKAGTRAQYIGIAGDAKISAAIPVLLEVMESTADPALRRAALQALQAFDDPAIGERAVALFPALPPDLRSAALALLTSRAGWSRQLLRAIAEGKIEAAALSADFVRAIRLHSDPAIATLAGQIWDPRGPATSADKDGQMRRLASIVNSGPGNAYRGRTLYQNACGGCHALFGQGGKVGPDLTSFQRSDVDRMLLNIIAPSAEIREGYEYFLIETADGRALSGFLTERNDQVVVMRGLDGQDITLDRKIVVRITPLGHSLMPEALIDGWSDQQVRDLFAYLRISQPLIGSAPAR